MMRDAAHAAETMWDSFWRFVVVAAVLVASACVIWLMPAASRRSAAADEYAVSTVVHGDAEMHKAVTNILHDVSSRGLSLRRLSVEADAEGRTFVLTCSATATRE